MCADDRSLCADDAVSLCADDSFAMCADDSLSMCADDALTTTHNFVTHHLSHTTLSHTIFHIQLCHILSFCGILRGRPGTYGTVARAWVGFSRR